MPILAPPIHADFSALWVWFTVCHRALTVDAAAHTDTRRDDSNRAMAQHYDSMIEHLNVLVDSVVYARYQSTMVGRNAPTDDRHRMLSYLESAFGFKRSELLGWFDVECVRVDADAIKHRLGLRLARETMNRTEPAPSSIPMPNDFEKLANRFGLVQSWCLEFAEATKHRIEETKSA